MIFLALSYATSSYITNTKCLPIAKGFKYDSYCFTLLLQIDLHGHLLEVIVHNEGSATASRVAWTCQNGNPLHTTKDDKSNIYKYTILEIVGSIILNVGNDDFKALNHIKLWYGHTFPFRRLRKLQN